MIRNLQTQRFRSRFLWRPRRSSNVRESGTITSSPPNYNFRFYPRVFGSLKPRMIMNQDSMIHRSLVFSDTVGLNDAFEEFPELIFADTVGTVDDVSIVVSVIDNAHVFKSIKRTESARSTPRKYEMRSEKRQFEHKSIKRKYVFKSPKREETS